MPHLTNRKNYSNLESVQIGVLPLFFYNYFHRCIPINVLHRKKYFDNPKLAGFLNPKPMKVTVYIIEDQWSDMGYIDRYANPGPNTVYRQVIGLLLSLDNGHRLSLMSVKCLTMYDSTNNSHAHHDQ